MGVKKGELGESTGVKRGWTCSADGVDSVAAVETGDGRRAMAEGRSEGKADRKRKENLREENRNVFDDGERV